MGMAVQGGKYFARDPEAESGLREISQAAYRSRMGGMDMAQAISKNPLASTQTSGDSTVSDEPGVADPTLSQNPPVQGQKGDVEIIDNQGALQGATAGGRASAKGIANTFSKRDVVKDSVVPPTGSSPAVWKSYLDKLEGGTLPDSAYVNR